MIRITKGLDVPVAGEPDQTVVDGPAVTKVGVVGDDYLGMKPTMAVELGDHVKLGQLLFTDKKTEGVRYTSPGCGTVTAINRGAKRLFRSIEITLEGDEAETFQSYYNQDLTTLTREQVRDNLLESGLWTAIRQRPYSTVADPATVPHSLFVTAIDTNPFAVNPATIIAENEREFTYGLQVLRKLTDGKLYLAKPPGTVVAGTELDSVTTEEFDGPHPAGLPGTHIHFLDPVNEKKTVWYVGYQDVIAIGILFTTGQLSVERVISLAGPVVNQPRVIRTRLGASIDELTDGQLAAGNNRIISGSVLSGRTAVGPVSYLGRYHLLVSALAEGTQREFLGWQKPGFDKFSVKRVFASSWVGDTKFPLTTSMGGSRRAMVPIGMYEQVMPLDILPTFLLRALIVEDTEQAMQLGCLELDEEDLALCTFVCPGKYEYGPMLRRSLNTIKKEG